MFRCRRIDTVKIELTQLLADLKHRKCTKEHNGGNKPADNTFISFGFVYSFQKLFIHMHHTPKMSDDH